MKALDLRGFRRSGRSDTNPRPSAWQAFDRAPVERLRRRLGWARTRDLIRAVEDERRFRSSVAPAPRRREDGRAPLEVFTVEPKRSHEPLRRAPGARRGWSPTPKRIGSSRTCSASPPPPARAAASSSRFGPLGDQATRRLRPSVPPAQLHRSGRLRVRQRRRRPHRRLGTASPLHQRLKASGRSSPTFAFHDRATVPGGVCGKALKLLPRRPRRSASTTASPTDGGPNRPSSTAGPWPARASTRRASPTSPSRTTFRRRPDIRPRGVSPPSVLLVLGDCRVAGFQIGGTAIRPRALMPRGALAAMPVESHRRSASRSCEHG